MNPFNDFVENGKIGQLFLGQSKRDTLKMLGEPNDWLGKATIIGETHEFFYQSELWYYYDGVVGARFGKNETIVELTLFVEKVQATSGVLNVNEWPAMCNITMEGWRLALEKHGLPYVESKDNLNYWILSGSTCIAACWPYPGGNEMPALTRPVLMVKKVIDFKMLADLMA